jgi:sulfate adenylyltransferase subunit 1
MKKDILRFLTCGSVDDGKSTLIGRMLYDSGSVYQDHLDELEKSAKIDGEVDLSLLTDGLEAEREQGITIDVAYRYFQTEKRKFIIADAPGHIQYTRNMAVAASNSEVAVILVDAAHGVKEQTIRHSYIASLLGIKKVIVAVNKMDKVNFKKEIFDVIEKKYLEIAKEFAFDSITFVPLSALKGDNVVNKSEKLSWYDGDTFLTILENITIAEEEQKPLRFSVQNVIRDNDNKRGYQGRLISGNVAVGDDVFIYSIKKDAKVTKIIHSSKSVEKAEKGNSVTLFIDRELDVNRGSFFSHKDELPHFSDAFQTHIVWFAEDALMAEASKEYLIKINHNLIRGKFKKINHLVNINDLSTYQKDNVEQNEIALVEIDLARKTAFDEYYKFHRSGAFLIIDPFNNQTLGAGVIERALHEEVDEKSLKFSDFEQELKTLINKYFDYQI